MFIEGMSLDIMAELADKFGYYICMTPYWEVQLLRLGSFTDRHNDIVLRINPKFILDKDYDSVRDTILLAREYICGFDQRLFSTDSKEFISEVLIPDYNTLDSNHDDVPEEHMSSFIHNFNRNFNWSMVTCCIQYILDRQCVDFETCKVLRAPCFNEGAFEMLTLIDTEDAETIVNGLYLNDKIKRHA